MRVLLLFSSSELGGAERSLSRMALSQKDISYHFATLSSEGPWCDWIRSQSHEPLVFGRDSHQFIALTIACWRVVFYLRQHPVDLIYICGARAATVIRFLRIFIPGTKLVHGIRWNPDSNSILDRFFRIAERFTYRLVDGWIANSDAAKQTLVKRCQIPHAKIAVIYNGLEYFPDEITPLEERPMEVLTVANLSPRKGHIEYLRVIKAVINAIPKARFIFIGRDDMNGAVQRAIEYSGLSNYVYYNGFHSNVTPWYKRARLFVLPSVRGEGCPTSILEAFSHGLPVVAYGIDGIPELVVDHVDGALVEPGDSRGLGSAIEGLLGDVGASQRAGQAGRNKVLRGFRVEQCVSSHAKFFHLLVDGQSE